MVANFDAQQSLSSRLFQGLSLIPKDWLLTPVLGDKRPYRSNWQKEILSRDEILEIVAKGDTISRGENFTKTYYPQGYGLKTGTVSGGILAIDCDGQSAQEKLNQMGELPETVAFTSGRNGRCQYLVRVPQEYWGVVQTIKIKTGVKGEDGKEQLLELRWDGCQSVLPPSVHPKTGNYQWVNSPQDCNVAECPIWLLEFLLNQSTPAAAPTPLLHLPTSDVPLYQCLSKDDRALIDSGTGEGDRNDKGAKLARNLIGTAARLQYLGHGYEGDPRCLFDDYCAKCSPPIDNREVETIWRSAEQDNPTATLTDEAIENCIKSWNRQQLRGGVQEIKQNNVIPLLTAKTQPIDFDGIKADYLELLASGANNSQVEQFKIATRHKFPLIQPGELAKLLDATGEEFRKSESFLDDQEELAKLVESSEATINLSDYLPPVLAKPLSMYADRLKIRHAATLLSLLTSISSLHRVGTKITLCQATDFDQPPTLYGSMVGESGIRKSPIYKALAKKPLGMMRQTRHDEYTENLALYEQELAEWELRNSDLKRGQKPLEPQPTPPTKPPIFYVTDATGEGIKTQAQSAPDKALYLLIDELAGLFGSQNAYRGGRGSDRQDVLSYYDGTGATVLRSGGVKVDIPQIYLSIFGTIQPAILKKLMGDSSDADGSWARFLFAVQPNIPATLPEVDKPSGVDFSEVLTSYFEKTYALEKQEYKLSPGAYKVFAQTFAKLEVLRVSEFQGGMKAVYGKAAGQIGRIALNLHILHELAAGRIPSTEVGADMIVKAIALMKFYMGQVKLIHATVNDSDSIAPHILKIIDLSKRKQLCGDEGWIKSRAVQQNSSKANRPGASDVREWMIQASKLGYGVIKGVGTKLEFKFVGSVGFCRSTVGSVSTVENLTTQGIQDSVGFVGSVDGSKPTNTQIKETPQNMEENNNVVDFSEPPHLQNLQNAKTVDTQRFEPVGSEPTVEPTVYLQKAETTDIQRFEAEPTEPTVEPTVDSQNQNVDIIPVFDLKEGYKIRCYPTQGYYEQKKLVDATVTQTTYHDKYLFSCEVEYTASKKIHDSWVKESRKATICGANADTWIKAITNHCG